MPVEEITRRWENFAELVDTRKLAEEQIAELADFSSLDDVANTVIESRLEDANGKEVAFPLTLISRISYHRRPAPPSPDPTNSR